ncbi:MAG: hypothetical protein WBF90_35900 [Rivularia sp. (in: cyanobacteria)]
MKLIEKLDQVTDDLAESSKDTLIYTLEVFTFCTEIYNGIFGYPFGGILLWSLVWLLISALIAGVTNGI